MSHRRHHMRSVPSPHPGRGRSVRVNLETRYENGSERSSSGADGEDSDYPSTPVPPFRSRGDSWIDRQAMMTERAEEPMSGGLSVIFLCLAWILTILTLPFSLFFCIQIVKEYERVVIFRIGRLIHGGPRGPGIFFILPCIDTLKKVDLREVSFDVPPQEVLSKDSVTVSVDAVVFFHISNPIVSVTNVNDAAFSTKLLAQTTLRNILGTKTLTEMLSERDSISSTIQKILDEGTDPWGVKVERVEVKDIRLPHQLMRVMAAEAEAARDAAARVIAAEGEQEASRALRDASNIISKSPIALHLRYLQTLAGIASEHSSTIVFPVPVQLLQAMGAKMGAVMDGKSCEQTRNLSFLSSDRKPIFKMPLTCSDICKMICSLIIPPIGVFLEKGCSWHLLLNIVLTILGYFPGLIHACFVIIRY